MSEDRLLEYWLADRADSTKTAYRFEYARLKRFCPCPLADVTPEQAHGFNKAVLSGLSKAAQHRTIAALNSLYAFALRMGYLTQNPFALVRQVRVAETLHERILTRDEVSTIIKAEPKPHIQTALALLYFGGLRVSELCGLRNMDVTPRDNSLQITVTGKGERTRTVLLHPAFTARLSAMLTQNPIDFVFHNSGVPFNPNYLWRRVKYAIDKCKLNRPVSPHWFRHAHASHALENGATIKEIQSTLGHVDISTTGRYLHLRPDSSSSVFLKVEGEK